MKSVCLVYGADFRNLSEANQHVAGDVLEGMVDLVLTDARHNMKNGGSMDSSSMTSLCLRT